jgi:hypothetical protein
VRLAEQRPYFGDRHAFGYLARRQSRRICHYILESPLSRKNQRTCHHREIRVGVIARNEVTGKPNSRVERANQLFHVKRGETSDPPPACPFQLGLNRSNLRQQIVPVRRLGLIDQFPPAPVPILIDRGN